MRLWLIAVPLSLGVGALVASACVGDSPSTATPSETNGGDAGDDVAMQGADSAAGDAAAESGPACDYAAKVTEDHPLYYYRFAVARPPNEGIADGGIIGDAATVVAPGAVACDTADKAARIDGTAGIELRGDLDAPLNTPFSIELLFEPEPGTEANARLFTRESYPEGDTTDLHGYNLAYDPTVAPKRFYFTRYAYQDAGAKTIPEAVALNFEDKPGFRHVVATFDGTNMKVYVDGGMRAFIASTVQPRPSPDARTLIGARIKPGGAFDARFKGRIDEVAYYNYALSEARVALHYAAMQH